MSDEKTPKKTTKPREKKAKPNPLAGITPEMDALVAAAGAPDDERGDLSAEECALIVAGMEAALAKFRAGDSVEGVAVLRKVDGYVFDYLKIL